VTDQEQYARVKCPHCGWIRRVPVGAIEDLSYSTVARGLGDRLKAVVDKIRTALADPELDEANAWIDLPPCPHCQNAYQYHVRTGECR